MKCIVGLIHKSAGSIWINGEEAKGPEQRRALGYLPEQPYFYDHLTVFETVEFFASLHGMHGAERKRRVTETLDRVGIADRTKSSVRSLSKGLQQRVGVAQAIVNKPELLLLDEPFSGLDPIGRLELRNLILELKREGTTIFLSSHILSDVEDICDRVSIMARGELRTTFHLKDSSTLFGEAFQLLLKVESPIPVLTERYSKLASEFKISETTTGQYLEFHFQDYATAQACIQDGLTHGARLEAFKSCGLNLEDIFMAITGGKDPSATATQDVEKNKQPLQH
jgi:ABC-2 type transport system ATP-binding protein